MAWMHNTSPHMFIFTSQWWSTILLMQHRQKYPLLCPPYQTKDESTTQEYSQRRELLSVSQGSGRNDDQLVSVLGLQPCPMCGTNFQLDVFVYMSVCVREREGGMDGKFVIHSIRCKPLDRFLHHPDRLKQ